MIYFFLLLLLPIIIIFIVGWALSAPGHKGPPKNHWDGTKFNNPSGQAAGDFGKTLKWFMQRDSPKWQWEPGQTLEAPAETVQDLSITFINHASFLLQFESYNILTDPIFEDRVSPFSWAGPHRMRPPGIPFDRLPSIDAVLISHNHYDHLEKKTILRLWEAFQPQFIVPLGVKGYFISLGIEKVKELDWWEKVSLDDKIITSVPAQHFSGRGFFDRDKTLWCGYVIESNSTSVYFAGDSGFEESLFVEIGERMGPFRVSMIPIGAYVPKWFMSPIHMSPVEALRVHQLVRSQQSIGMHYGTFPLADDKQGQPEKDLMNAIKSFGVKEEEFILLQEGIPFIPL